MTNKPKVKVIKKQQPVLGAVLTIEQAPPPPSTPKVEREAERNAEAVVASWVDEYFEKKKTDYAAAVSLLAGGGNG
jgi:hypothetical protein